MTENDLPPFPAGRLWTDEELAKMEIVTRPIWRDSTVERVARAICVNPDDICGRIKWVGNDLVVDDADPIPNWRHDHNIETAKKAIDALLGPQDWLRVEDGKYAK